MKLIWKKLIEVIYPQIPREEILILMNDVKNKKPTYNVNSLVKKNEIHE